MNKKIPSIIAIFILIVGVGVGVFLLQSQQVFRLGASPTAIPKNVTITNVTDVSLSVSWTTDEPTTGYLKWGQDEIKNTTDTETQKSNTHHITLRGLSPQTSYQFSIYVDGQQHLNNNTLWTVTTGIQLEPPAKSQIISGKIVSNDGAPVIGAIVYAQVQNSIPLSTTTSADGQWFISLANARSQDKGAYVNITDESLLELFVEAGPNGNSAAKILVSNANPNPEIVLGEVYDFTQTDSISDNSAPEADLDLPEEGSQATSKFEADENNNQNQEETQDVVLTSIDEEEVIYTQNPEFFGQGPAGETITATVESDPVTEQVLVDNFGNWSWNPPTDLEEGEHTLTISWRDTSGILRSITRNFTVQAAEGEPSFESTPSGTLKPSPTPTIAPTTTSTPTSSPSASPSSSPTISPISSPTATAVASQMPNAGTWENTVALVIAGFFALSLGLYLSLKN